MLAQKRHRPNRSNSEMSTCLTFFLDTFSRWNKKKNYNAKPMKTRSLAFSGHSGDFWVSKKNFHILSIFWDFQKKNEISHFFLKRDF